LEGRKSKPIIILRMNMFFCGSQNKTCKDQSGFILVTIWQSGEGVQSKTMSWKRIMKKTLTTIQTNWNKQDVLAVLYQMYALPMRLTDKDEWADETLLISLVKMSAKFVLGFIFFFQKSLSSKLHNFSYKKIISAVN
jgi:hypothetical protein